MAEQAGATGPRSPMCGDQRAGIDLETGMRIDGDVAAMFDPLDRFSLAQQKSAHFQAGARRRPAQDRVQQHS